MAREPSNTEILRELQEQRGLIERLLKCVPGAVSTAQQRVEQELKEVRRKDAASRAAARAASRMP